MSPRALIWIGLLSVGDIVIFIVTLHAQLTYTPGPSDPPHSSTTLSIVVGFIVSAGLVLVIMAVIAGAREAARNRQREQRRRV